MTHKEIAGRLRESISHAEKMTGATLGSFRKIANELDPPRPEPGTVVWWRWNDTDWEPGIVFDRDSIVDQNNELVSLDDIEWKPARILADDEVAVKVPPVSEWPEDCDRVNVWLQYTNGLRGDHVTTITRAEAEAREAGR